MNPSYNNLGGFGSGGAIAPPPVSSGTGDIVLAPEKRSHKGIIIAIILAVLIIGGILAVMFLTSGGGRNTDVSNEAKLAFNKYANYLLYGGDSNKVLEGEYDEDGIYKLDEMRSESAQAVTNYFKTANEFLTNFESLASGNIDDELMTAINNYRANFELVMATFNKEYITEEELVNEVLNNNLDDTKVWIANKYTNLTKLNYENIRQYAEAEINYYQLYAEYLENLKTRDCFEDSAACNVDIDESLESQMMEYNEKVVDTKKVAEKSLIEDCWTIEKLMGERGES